MKYHGQYFAILKQCDETRLCFEANRSSIHAATPGRPAGGHIRTYLSPTRTALASCNASWESILVKATPRRIRETYYEYGLGELLANSTFVRKVENLDDKQQYWSYDTTEVVATGAVVIHETRYDNDKEIFNPVKVLLDLSDDAQEVWNDLFEPMLVYVTYRFQLSQDSYLDFVIFNNSGSEVYSLLTLCNMETSISPTFIELPTRMAEYYRRFKPTIYKALVRVNEFEYAPKNMFEDNWIQDLNALCCDRVQSYSNDWHCLLDLDSDYEEMHSDPEFSED
jgi:hypothetical protein